MMHELVVQQIVGTLGYKMQVYSSPLHLMAGCPSGSKNIAKFSRFTPEAPEEEMKVDGESVKPSGWPSLCL